MMLLDVVWQDGMPRFCYRRVGDVFWRALGTEPTGRFIDEVLPETAGYRDYVVGICVEMASRARPRQSQGVRLGTSARPGGSCPPARSAFASAWAKASSWHGASAAGTSLAGPGLRLPVRVLRDAIGSRDVDVQDSLHLVDDRGARAGLGS
jgi:hypothetical protein